MNLQTYPPASFTNSFLIRAPVISRRQGPDCMQMIGRQHYGGDIERPSLFGFVKDGPKPPLVRTADPT